MLSYGQPSPTTRTVERRAARGALSCRGAAPATPSRLDTFSSQQCALEPEANSGQGLDSRIEQRAAAAPMFATHAVVRAANGGRRGTCPPSGPWWSGWVPRGSRLFTPRWSHERRFLVLVRVDVRLHRLGGVPSVAAVAVGEVVTRRQATALVAITVALAVLGVVDAACAWALLFMPLGVSR